VTAPSAARWNGAAAALGLSDSVLFAGQQASVAPYYGIAEISVLPSHSEGSHNVLLEAMAAGLPMVSTGAGGAAELVSNENIALVVDCRLGTAAQLASRSFTPEAYVASLVQLYQAVADDSPAGRGN
jgi:glycosyltransferase involved in cell wall biosynthesis